MSLAENIEILHEEAAKAGASADTVAYLASTMKAESKGSTHAKNSRSSASGIFQFINRTWYDICGRHGIDASDKHDPRAQCQAAIALAGENAEALRDALGREPNAGEQYLAHVLGSGGAKKILCADAATPIHTLLGAEVMSANAPIKFRGKHFAEFTAGDICAWASAKMNVNMPARETYQRRHDARKPGAQPTPEEAQEDAVELAERQRIAKEWGLPAELTKSDNILGRIFIALLQMLVKAAETPAERAADVAMAANPAADHNNVTAPSVPNTKPAPAATPQTGK